MDVYPDLERFNHAAGAALQNLDVLGVDVSSPSRMIFGHVPTIHEEGFSGAAGMYSSDADTAFISARTSIGIEEDPKEAVIISEHEMIHAEQLNRYLGRPQGGFMDSVQRFEEEATSAALQLFDRDNDFVDAYVDDGYLSTCSLKRMAASLVEDMEILESLYSIYRKKQDRIEEVERLHSNVQESEQSDKMSPEEYAEMKENLRDAVVRTGPNYGVMSEVDEYVEDNWERIRGDPALEFIEPVFSRHEPDVRDDILEAQAQFWSLFRYGALDELPADGHNLELEESLEEIDNYYTGHVLYEYGENVRNMTELLIDEYRERRDTGTDGDPDAAAQILNEGLEYWETSTPIAREPAV